MLKMSVYVYISEQIMKMKLASYSVILAHTYNILGSEQT